MSLLTLLLGKPLASAEQEQQKIGVFAGVPAMGLDGLSSAAYGPEAAMAILVPLGAVGLVYITPIMLAILVLLAMLYFSYRQTITAYPLNGGSYTVASQNLGENFGLLAAGALMIDYILTVAVGISAGVAALVSAAPHLQKFTLPLCLIILAFVTLMNLRGTSQAGVAFALPTYSFIFSLGLVLAIGVARALTSGGHPHPLVPPPPLPRATETAGLWLMLRAFASGCTAMTGVEAVSNGVSAFRDPKTQNAHRTLTVIVATLAVLLAVIAYLAHAYGIAAMDQEKHGYRSVLSQLSEAVVGRGWFYYFTIGSVLTVLCLSANTSFVDFPRLSRLLADDGFLPKWFSFVGSRLVFSVGILFLSAASAVLLIVFRGITDKLIPLYAVGAFLAFTLSQAGMVQHWRGRGKKGKSDQPVQNPRDSKPSHADAVRVWVNGVGALATAGALVIILAAKFIEGAWITVLVIPSLFILFKLTNRHYTRVKKQIATPAPLNLKHNEPPVVLVPMRQWDRLANKAMRFAMRLSKDVIGVHLCNVDGSEGCDAQEQVRRDWATDVQEPSRAAGVPIPRLDIIQSPFRSFLKPLMQEVRKLEQEFPHREIAIVVPEVISKHWWGALLHRQRASRIRSALMHCGDRQVIVISVPWYVETEPPA